VLARGPWCFAVRGIQEARRAAAKDLAALHKKAAEDYVGFLGDIAVSEIHWHRPFSVPLDDTDAPNYRWFSDGQFECVLQLPGLHLGTGRRQGRHRIRKASLGDVRRLT